MHNLSEALRASKKLAAIYLIQISPFNAYIMNLIFSKLHNTFLSNTLLKKLAKYSKYIYDIWKLFS